MTEPVHVVPLPQMRPDGAFVPHVGAVTNDLVARVAPPGAADQLEAEAVRVLSRCRNPADRSEGAMAQLVVGRVQSGKTMSFTSVIALARDNGFPLVVVLAGTKKNLLEQTVNRLQNDLRLNGDGGPNVWRHWQNPGDADRAAIAGSLQSWRPDVPEAFRQTAVLFVLKHSSRLSSAASTLESVLQDPRLRMTPALIVDDEADQASLNTKALQGSESSVYSALRELRNALPNHSFLMYTATPQAPLLVSLADTISPDKVTVLTGGEDYVGGQELFEERAKGFVREVPDAELSIALDPDSVSPPPSLNTSLATFLLALVIAQRRGKPRPLSMLIHPAHKRDLHQKYDQWTAAILEAWRVQLRHQDDVAYTELRETAFRDAFNDLSGTCADVEPTTEFLDGLLREVYFYLGQIEQRVVNSATGHEIREIEWGQFPGWIVIGGNKLDRGFTVKNLAVTYMPRGQGVGNADTLQQRGRFFGYKRPYLDLLRGWFSRDVAQSFRSYVLHEAAMHAELVRVDASNESLKTWRRRFLLDPAMKLTRRQVISMDTRSQLVQGWAFRQTGLFDESVASANAANVATVRRWLTDAQPHPSDARGSRQNTSVIVAGREVLDLLVQQWEAVPDEAERLDQILFALAHVMDERDEMVEVIGMDGLDAAPRERELRIDPPNSQPPRMREDWRINGLFQGRSAGYPGDDQFLSPRLLTVQFHLVRPKAGSLTTPTLSPAIAIGVPADYAARVTWQNDGV